MSAPADAPKQSPVAAPESPTTARPLEMDDDDVQETGVLDNSQSTPGAAPASSEAPPPKPPRPMTEAQKHILMLKEAFPTIDEPVIKAVLTASRGHVEPAFNALLQMTDPDAVKDDDDQQPPPQPPRPTQQRTPTSSTAMTQMEADEQYARQLAEHYENISSYEARTSNRTPGHGYGPPPQRGVRPQDDDREHSFIDDELPIIKENLRKGFIETQTKFNEWFTTMKKKMDGDEDDLDYHDDGPRPGHGRPGRRQAEPNRRSNDYDTYDADPQLLTDDFAGMKFKSDGTPARRPGQGQGQPQMGVGNSNVFRPPPKSTSPSGRKVAFVENAEDIDDIYDNGPSKPVPKDAPAPGKASKWQPLTSVEPNPIADNDPFSLGDSDDEKEAKEKGGSKAEQGELQKATAEAMADSLVDSSATPSTEVKKA
ncbi:hypothetical protein MKZ38_003678 [Zalerion maritima]|uniref:CUE domain-containing protein n=1 Tax=Zalerion maritima TaxID=339359 RepID=A0AAD5RNL7_9PEZI|nr:hypothetical protein MKZ38_003678 [Zalerion maritima]